MIPSYQFYHGAILHELVSKLKRDLVIALHDFHGRADAYVLDGEVGLLIKYSSKRLSPWVFTLAKEHIDEFSALSSIVSPCFLGLVCGEDGFLCLRDSQVAEILAQAECGAAALRVSRRPRGMYGVTAARRELDRKVAMGVDEIVRELLARRELVDSVAVAG